MKHESTPHSGTKRAAHFNRLLEPVDLCEKQYLRESGYSNLDESAGPPLYLFGKKAAAEQVSFAVMRHMESATDNSAAARSRYALLHSVERASGLGLIHSYVFPSKMRLNAVSGARILDARSSATAIHGVLGWSRFGAE